MAVEAPPSIPNGQVMYDEVSYQNAADSELPPEFITGPTSNGGYDALAATPAAPITPAQSSSPHTVINLHAYATDYQVRGMGLTDGMTKYGTSSLEISHTFLNRNLFKRGFQQRVHGMAGAIWDASCPLGEIPQFELGYAIGKEVFPNLLIELGYHFRRGGFEGYMAKWYDHASHRSAQDVAISATYNDFQKGFFGHAECGWGFYGLTGLYFDFELGYRFAEAIRTARMGADLEVSVGAAPSLGYWGAHVEGLDACRVRVAVRPYSYGKYLGRDSHTQIKPWVQCSWSGDNARKIARHTNFGPVDHFQITFGLDIGWKF